MRLRFVALLLITRVLGAQASAPRGVVDGIVADSALRPLGSATVWMLGTSLEVTTRENGRFRMNGVPSGEYVIVVRRIGYAPFSTVIQVPAADTARPSFVLETADVSLDTIRVTAAAPNFSPMLRGFEDRRLHSQGQFMTADEIRKLNFVGLSDLLYTFKSVKMGGGGVPLNARSFFDCPYQWFVDGVIIPTPRNVDTELPPPSLIHGIEVYSTAGTIPVEYATFGDGQGNLRRGGSFCGVILVWTKR